MTVYISSITNPEGTTCAIAVHTINDMKVLKDKYGMVLLDGCHLRINKEIETNEYRWSGLQDS